MVPQIFDGNTEDGVRQINPDTTFSAFGMGSGSSNALMSTMYSTDVFSEMMGNTAIVEEQYDVKAGRWPSAYNECVVVLTASGTVPDLVSYALGLRDHAVLEDMIDQFMNEEDVESPDDNLTFTYDEIMGVSLKMVPAADFYTYDEENKVWVDKTGDEEYMKGLVDAGEELKIVGIVQPRPDAKATALSMGIYYTPELTRHLIEQASEAAIVQEQLNYPTIDVFNGKEFTEEEESGSDFSMENLFSIDEEALQNAFKFDESKLNMDTSALGEGMSASDLPAMPGLDASALNLDMTSAFNSDAMGEMMGAALAGYTQALGVAYAQAAASGTPPDFQTLAQSTLESYAQSPELQAIMGQYAAQIVDANALQKEMATKISAALESSMKAYMEQVMATITAKTQASVQKVMGDMAASIPLAMSVDTGAFQNAFQMKMTEEELTELIMSLMTNGTRCLRREPEQVGLRGAFEALADRHLPGQLRGQTAGHRHSGRLQRPHGGLGAGRQESFLHGFRGHAHEIGHDDRGHDQLRAHRVRGHFARGVVHHDRHHHLHLGARAQEGDRHPARHRREQGRHLAGVQRRDHHRGPDGGPYRRGGRGACVHSGQRHCVRAFGRARHRHAAAGGRSDPRGHQRVPVVCCRPVPRDGRRPQRPG